MLFTASCYDTYCYEKPKRVAKSLKISLKIDPHYWKSDEPSAFVIMIATKMGIPLIRNILFMLFCPKIVDCFLLDFDLWPLPSDRKPCMTTTQPIVVMLKKFCNYIISRNTGIKGL